MNNTILFSGQKLKLENILDYSIDSENGFDGGEATVTLYVKSNDYFNQQYSQKFPSLRKAYHLVKSIKNKKEIFKVFSKNS